MPPSASSEPSSATETLALRDQIDLQIGGDGLFLTCRPDDEDWQEPAAPAVWMNNLFSLTEYPGNVVLCLKGFAADEPVTVTTTTGPLNFTATVTPVTGSPPVDQPFLYEALPAETLFDNNRLSVYTETSEGQPVDDRPGELLISETWSFLPPGSVRDALADSDGFTLSARQGDREATASQAVRTPTVPTLQVLDRTGSEGERRAVVLGYPAGSRVPVGLYRRAGRDSEQARLATTLGTIDLPTSRIAVLPLEKALSTAEDGFYCVAPPVEGPIGCDAVEIWADYPGLVREGDTGRRVLTWQRILIQADIIADRDANRDGVFGPATARAVDSYLENSGSTNPDGNDTLGPGMYKIITG